MTILDLPQLAKRYSTVATALDRLGRAVVFSCANTQKAHLVATLGRQSIYVVADEKVDAVAKTLTQLGVKAAVLPAQFDILIHRLNANLSNVSARVGALLGFAKGDIDVLVLSPKSLLQYVPHKDLLLGSVLTISVGDTLDPVALGEKLASMGYTRAFRAEVKGTYAVFGDLVEIFAPSEEMPVRIVSDFDTVESIKYYAPETMQGMGRVDSLTLPPASEMLADVATDKIMDRIAKSRQLQNPKAAARTGEILDDVSLRLAANPKDAGLHWLLPFVKEGFGSVLEYLPKDGFVTIDGSQQIFDLLSELSRAHKERVSKLVADGEVLRKHVESIYSVDEVSALLKAVPTLGFSNLVAGHVDEDKGMFAFGSTNLPDYFRDVNLMAKDLAEYVHRGYDVRLYCGTPEWAKTMGELLHGVAVTLLPDRLDKGFIYSTAKVVVVGTADMSLSTVAVKEDAVSRRVEAPKAGDYVVHDEYGIGRCLGVQHVKSYVGEMDYLVLQYAGENKIYVPMHQMSLLKLYAGAETTPKLSNPNKEEFKQQKAKAKAGIRKLAFDLLELYAKREQTQGYRYPADTAFQKEFEAAFEFEETPDQLQAIADIKRDMESGKVMDRLICGDVGFGKTEVALRAVFKTVMQNKQAAFLAPTTILAEQHYMTVLSRLQPFGVKVACLSRFRTPKEVKEILTGVQNGTISVVVGTHRLLSKDVEFFDLGLLVLDEEQRFGVEHKEKIKTMRNNVNVISMSATPIPRTLHMALSGIRDVSVLDTPPKGRQEVETVVCEYSDALVEDAIRAEIDRGGQAFVLYNSVEKIYGYVARLQQLMPDVTFVLGHGKMSAKELEGNVYKFFSKEAQVLVATTIIENGIDIPNANTLIALESNRLGLSQMYQLKGRVGRSTRQAKAYFTYPEGYVPTGDVEKRLTALTDNAGLGAGYRLALMDLEIRGAGDVLGREQHGHVERIGYDMYCRLLKETIALLKGEVVATATNTEVAVSVDAYIPETYVSSERERLRLYQRIASLPDEKEGEALLADMTDLFGKPPKEVERLVNVSLLRVLGSRVGVSKVEIDNRFCRVRWVSPDYPASLGVQSALRKIGDECRLVSTPEFVEIMPVKNLVGYKMQVVKRFLRYCNGNYT